MASTPKSTIEGVKPPIVTASSHAKYDGNPVFRMMGLPRLRARLPSRNWLIFLSITGSFTSAIFYDRYHTKKVQQKWCHVVSHLATQPLPANQVPRKIRIFLSAPPGDGIRSAREYFQEYVKPVLVAAAVDWDVVEGRREGDIRAELAELIRLLRRKNGERSTEPEPEDLVEEVRRKAGILPSDGVEGDLVLGRHTWKEYVRGLHEGWLGPLNPPPESKPPVADTAIAPALEPGDDKLKNEGSPTDNELNESTTSMPSEQPTPPDRPRKPSGPTPSYILPSEYPNSSLAPTIDKSLPPATPLPFPHILGFVNTPIRVYRFLTKRYTADSIGEVVARVVLTDLSHPWKPAEQFVNSNGPASGVTPTDHKTWGYQGGADIRWEQQGSLANEEHDWHKSVRKRPEPGPTGEESVWADVMTVDARVGERMTTFVTDDCHDGLVRVMVDRLAADGERVDEAGWVPRLRKWAGWTDGSKGAKGWEQGLVVDESD